MAPGGPTRVLGDRYELRNRLGSGGAGTVWRGYDRALDRLVAVKLLHAELADDPAAESRFRTEATAAAKLTHPNAVLVYDLGRDGADDYLVMELVEGASLADVARDGPLLPGLAAAVGAMIAGALGTAHDAGIVHRDVKPGNVLVTSRGTAKLADFGIARALGEVTARLTRTGTVLGTARYLAPEQLRDDPIDARADVYALGLVIHEILTGRAPFGEGNAVEVAARRLTTSLPAVRDLVDGVSDGLDEVVRWATRVDPRERPADGGVLAEALRTFSAHDATRALATRVGRVPRRTTTPEACPDEVPAADRRGGTGPPAPGRPVTGRPDGPPPPSGPRRDRPPPDHEGSRAAHATAPPQQAPPPRSAPLPAVATAAPAPPPGGTSAFDPVDRGAAAGGTSSSTGRDGAEVSTPSTSSRWVLAVVAAGAIGLVVALNTAGGGRPEVVAADPAVPLRVVEASDHDPQGGDGERPADIPNAFDDDPATFWPTETYGSADFRGLAVDKEGVGLWLQAEDPVAFDRVEVALSEPGGSLELWVGDGSPADDELPGDWGRLVGRGEVPERRFTFPDLPDGTEGDTLLLWFTELPPAGDAFRAEVRDVRVYGR